MYTLEAACTEIERLQGHVKALQITNDGLKAAEQSETGVYHMALQDMSLQLQTAAAERAACQTKMLQLHECAVTATNAAAPSHPSSQARSSCVHRAMRM